MAPLGGDDVSAGPNSELQFDYLVWRTECIELLADLPDASHLVRELASDTRGEQFYKASASRVLGVMKAARLLTG